MFVYVFDSEYERFLHRSLPAFRANREYLEILVGRRYRAADGFPGFLVVANFFPVDHWAEEGYVFPLDDEYGDAQQQAKEVNQQVLGSIHTHPDCGLVHSSAAFPSDQDYLSFVYEREFVSGVVHQYLLKKHCVQSSPVFISCFEPCFVRHVTSPELSALKKDKKTMRDYHRWHLFHEHGITEEKQNTHHGRNGRHGEAAPRSSLRKKPV